LNSLTQRIVIMAGGTGGHVFPALAVAEQLRTQGWTVTWLGTQQGLEARVVPAQGFEIDWLDVSGFRGKGLKFKLKSLFFLLKASIQAFHYLRLRQPNVVLGMGGFVAAPGGLMARCLGIPLIIHEQNRVVGTTNRWLAKIATQVLQAFPASFPAQQPAICSGNPLRAEFVDFPEKMPWQIHRPLNILIVGGSLGAQILNEIAPAAMARLQSVAVKHQTGTAMIHSVRAAYQKLGVNAEVLAFIEDMPKAYQWADLVICRAGAMTVSEVAAAGLAAVFIPLPHAIDDHQTANARYLTEAGAGILLTQTDLTAESLATTVQQHLPRLAEIGAAAKKLARREATQTVAQICIHEAKA
jgi:UDP-N-acetylglucosamine--N-acetylmuramyl-(pentapeptide) pyrophosphoryl-undecaprenol N-acetylglucosamine transferase